MAIQEPPAQGTNLIGLTKNDYKGRPSTLCKGCGHDSISARIISVAYDLALKPSQVIKLSGIGCSSKSPAYFMGRSHAFNSVHGRMPSIAAGATLANRSLITIGISGDGVDQDDLIAAAGGAGFAPPAAIRSDQIFVRGVRLPFLKFPRSPNL